MRRRRQKPAASTSMFESVALNGPTEFVAAKLTAFSGSEAQDEQGLRRVVVLT